MSKRMNKEGERWKIALMFEKKVDIDLAFRVSTSNSGVCKAKRTNDLRSKQKRTPSNVDFNKLCNYLISLAFLRNKCGTKVCLFLFALITALKVNEREKMWNNSFSISVRQLKVSFIWNKRNKKNYYELVRVRKIDNWMSNGWKVFHTWCVIWWGLCYVAYGRIYLIVLVLMERREKETQIKLLAIFFVKTAVNILFIQACTKRKKRKRQTQFTFWLNVKRETNIAIWNFKIIQVIIWYIYIWDIPSESREIRLLFPICWRNNSTENYFRVLW